MNGRNLDYGHSKSDSREGSMAKKALLTMAKDLYELYVSLHDEDDLPQWCHYKLAKSQSELESIANYLTSKISKTCVDQNIDSHNIRNLACESVLRNVINKSLRQSVIKSLK